MEIKDGISREIINVYAGLLKCDHISGLGFIQVKYKHYEVSSTPQPKENVDFVSPPNPDSNIRKVVYSKARSRDEEDLNSERWQTNLWNDDFWKNHNKKFFKVSLVT